ncbi:MAG: hypothetical protein PHD43_23920 [Methylococcales bacterium]|nr:hypothetical protein [Methylococcales bacterium]
MTTHILSMTYGPKIAGVRDGTIRQTIRRLNPKRPFKLGDKLLIHGWSGKPYRSPWNWRMEAVVKELDRLEVDNEDWVLWDHYDLTHEGFCTALNPWDDEHPVIDRIAKADGIVPPTGLGLKAVLESMHGPFTDEDIEFQIIRW